MRNWALHHLHLMIFLDAFLHATIVGLLVALWVLMLRFYKLCYGRGRFSNALLNVMVLIVVYMTGVGVWGFWECARHYAEWWHR